MIGQVAQERGHQVATSRPYRYVRHPMYLSLVLNWPALALLLGSLQHQNGAPLGKIYGPQDTHMRGGTIPLNILNPAGKVIDERVVEQAAM